jgi:hypothetical protein
MKKLILKIEKGRVKLELTCGQEVPDSLRWKENNSLSRLLLRKIDEILKRNKLSIDKISGYRIISDVPKNWTSVRIAKITFETLMLSRSAGVDKKKA